MKAVGFFLAVFLSMLVAFLLATGEFVRWFSPRSGRQGLRFELTSSGPEERGNIVKLDIWNVDLGRRSFTIWAELEGAGLRVDRPVDEQREVTLRNGTIEVPIYEDASGAEGAAAEAGPAEKEAPRLRNVKLDFERAVCRRLEGDGKRRGEFEVVLEKGRGFANDGTEFDFDDLVFTNRPPPELAEDARPFFLVSRQRVSVRNASLHMVSRKGLVGVLASRGLDRLRFLPPVSAVFDPSAPSLLRLAEPGSQASPASESGAEARSAKIAIRSEGPLELSFSERGGDGTRGGPSRLSVSFRKDVVIYSVEPGASASDLPEPAGNRFECQELDLELEGSGQQLSPQRALATWPGGRVRAVVTEGDPKRAVVIDGERVEWRPRRAEGETRPAGDAGAREPPIAGEAVLEGSPELRGPDMTLFADRAVLFLDRNRALLESVRGELAYALAKDGAGRGGAAKRAPKAPKQEPWDDELSAGGVRASEAKAERGEDRGAKRAPPLPSRWNLRADEAEIFFAGSSPGSASFSRLVARSKAPNGVTIESAPPETEPQAGASEVPRVRLSGDALAYDEAERTVTFEASEGRKPRIAFGTDWIEARKVYAFVDEDAAWFEGEVRGGIADLRALTSGRDAESLRVANVELSAASLTVRRDRETGRVGELWASGGEGNPAAISSSGDPRFRLSGAELLWSEERRVAQARGRAGSGADRPVRARVEFEGGDLVADRILFDHDRWCAQLADDVSIRAFERTESAGDRGEVLSVQAAKALVQFYPKLEPRGPQGAGAFEHLARVERVHARGAPERPIEIRGPTFAGRAEECAFDGGTSELRFFGEGFQEVEILRDDFRGPVRAREISYREAEGKVVLRGGVRGDLVQSPLAAEPAPELSSARLQPATARPEGPGGPLPWTFETNELAIWLERGAPGARVKLRALEASDKVLLRNDAHRLQLRGDDLRYEEATRKIHVFSRDGRPQTLFCDRYGSGSAPPSEAGETAHKIGAQEIWILLYENPHAPLRSGEPTSWLLVEFQRDVMASFHVPLSEPQSARARELGDTWKLVADKLALHIDASRFSAGDGALADLVAWALASGKVVFNAGIYQATADRALYEDGPHRLTLSGSPARLTRDGAPLESSPEIAIRKVGDVLEYTSAGRGRAVREPGR